MCVCARALGTIFPSNISVVHTYIRIFVSVRPTITVGGLGLAGRFNNADSARSAQSFRSRGTRLSRSLATLKEHVHGYSRANAEADAAAARGAAAAAGAPSYQPSAALAEENETLRATVGMMKDEMLRMKEEILAASPIAGALSRHR